MPVVMKRTTPTEINFAPLNLIRENSWKAGAKQASYIIQHPYISQPEIIVRSKNPSKTLKDAAQIVVDDAKAFSVAFKRAMKK